MKGSFDFSERRRICQRGCMRHGEGVRGSLKLLLAVARMLDSFAVHTVNHESYGTLFESLGSETVSARLVALPTPVGPCGEWMLNLEVAGLNTPAVGLGGGNPFALIIDDLTDANQCFDVTNAIVGSQIPTPPPHSTRRRVRRGR